jgi:hypothetical protein
MVTLHVFDQGLPSVLTAGLCPAIVMLGFPTESTIYSYDVHIDRARSFPQISGGSSAGRGDSGLTGQRAPYPLDRVFERCTWQVQYVPRVSMPPGRFSLSEAQFQLTKPAQSKGEPVARLGTSGLSNMTDVYMLMRRSVILNVWSLVLPAFRVEEPHMGTARPSL